MEPILSLPPDQFRAALAELALDPEREAFLVNAYNQQNAPQQGAGGRGMMYNLLDNIIGYDDDVVTPGERLGAGIEGFASGLLSDPVGTGADVVRGGYETIERAMAPGATPMDVLGAAGMAMGAGGMVTRPAGSVGISGRVAPDARASDWIDDLRSRYPNAQIDVSGGPDRGYTVSRIVVPEDARSQGIGTQIMREITDIADSQGATVALTPSSDFGGNVSRLRDFYRRMGFVANTGRNRDFSISEDMYREPISANRSTTAGLLASAASETPAQQVARLLREGRASEVTDDLMAQADPQEMARLYEAGETGMDLPMDEASRMARAQEMGFDTETPMYHATTADFPAFDLRFGGQNTGARDAEMAVFLGDQPRAVQHYAGQWEQELFRDRNLMEDVFPEIVRHNNQTSQAIQSAQAAGDSAATMAGSRAMVRSVYEDGANIAPVVSRGDFNEVAGHVYDPRRFNMEIRRAQAESASGVDFRNVNDIGEGGIRHTQRAVLDPNNIRSRFARFDPRLRHLANLNAANIDPLTGAVAMGASQQQNTDPLATLRAYLDATGGVLGR